jgi:hypothetical protein
LVPRVVSADGDELATEGMPVPVGEPVVILHCVTNQALAARLEDVQAYVHAPPFALALGVVVIVRVVLTGARCPPGLHPPLVIVLAWQDGLWP